MDLAEIGVIHGRFQVLHLDHMNYILAGKRRCKHLLIGITNPDPKMTAEHPANPSRSRPSSNPLTYYERFLMIRDSLLEASVDRSEFDIVPFPINYPELIKHYVPLNARFFLTVYDDWGRAKVELFKSLDLDVEVMWEKSKSEQLTCGEEVRGLIASDGEWQHLVPPAVVRIINDLSLDRRIREAMKGSGSD